MSGDRDAPHEMEPLDSQPPEDDGSADVADEQTDAELEAPEEWKDRLQRTVAELENLRKRSRREVGAARDRGVGDLATALLDVLDNLERALSSAATDDPLGQGVSMVHAQLLERLASFGVERLEPAGEPFDPHWHEAIAEVPREDVPAGSVLDVLQPGYRMGERLLRAATVRVASAPPDPPPES